MYAISNINFINSNFLEMIRQEIIRFNDNLYLLKAKYPQDRVRVDKVQELRELLECDIVLKNNGWLFYGELIPDVEIIE